MIIALLYIFVIYLLLGFVLRKPKDWSIPVKIITHIFWLPIAAAIVVTLLIGKWESKKIYKRE